MPVNVYRVRGGWRVRTGPKGARHTTARATTRANANRQAALLRAIDHGWRPTRRRTRRSR